MDADLHNAFTRLLKNAIFDAARATGCIVPDEGVSSAPQYAERNKAAALSYANSALAYCCAARSLYYAKLEELEHKELPGLFHLFSEFVHSVQKNYADVQSDMDVSLEFEKLQRAFMHSVGAEPIIEDET